MFDRFNNAARRALFFSRYEASLLGKSEIDSEHILLGLLRDGNEVTREIFRFCNVDPSKVRAAFPIPDPPPQVSSSAELPLSGTAKKILAHTGFFEAEEGRGETIGPETLLLAILRVGESHAARLLEDLGMTYEAVADAWPTVVQEAAAREEKKERTPIILRASHYDLLDLIRESMPLPIARRASRQQLVLAILDAMASTSIEKVPFQSVEEFTDAVKHQLLLKWPRE